MTATRTAHFAPFVGATLVVAPYGRPQGPPLRAPTRVALLALLAAVLAAPAAARADCADCHRRLAAEDAGAVARESARWLDEAHARAGLGCHRCHGGTPLATEAAAAHPAHLKATDPESAVAPARLAATCGTAECHAAKAAAFAQQPCAPSAEHGLMHCGRCHDASGASALVPGWEKGRCDRCHATPKTALAALRAGLLQRARIDARAHPARREALAALHRFDFAGFAARLAVVAPTPTPNGPLGRAHGNTCVACHERQAHVPGAPSARPSHGSAHAPPRVTCEACHGGDPTAAQKDAAHGNEVASRLDPHAKTHPARTPETCGVCHQAELAAFRRSKHFEHLAGASDGPDCVRCHQAMDVHVMKSSELHLVCRTCHKPGGQGAPAAALDAEKALAAMETWWSNYQRTRRVLAQNDHESERSAQAAPLAAAHALSQEAVVAWHAFDVDAVRALTARATAALDDVRRALRIETTASPVSLRTTWVRAVVTLLVLAATVGAVFLWRLRRGQRRAADGRRGDAGAAPTPSTRHETPGTPDGGAP